MCLFYTCISWLIHSEIHIIYNFTNSNLFSSLHKPKEKKIMLDKFKIFYWLLTKNIIYIFLFLTIFFKKNIFIKLRLKENLSYKESKKICTRLLINKKEIYNYFLKIQKKRNFHIKKKFLKILKLQKKKD